MREFFQNVLTEYNIELYFSLVIFEFLTSLLYDWFKVKHFNWMQIGFALIEIIWVSIIVTLLRRDYNSDAKLFFFLSVFLIAGDYLYRFIRDMRRKEIFLPMSKSMFGTMLAYDFSRVKCGDIEKVAEKVREILPECDGKMLMNCAFLDYKKYCISVRFIFGTKQDEEKYEGIADLSKFKLEVYSDTTIEFRVDL